MSKSKAQRALEIQAQKEADFIREQEIRADGPWKCGIKAVGEKGITKICATCLTEEAAKEYFRLKIKGGSVFPHRLVVEDVGWWEASGPVPEDQMGIVMREWAKKQEKSK